MKKPKPRRNKEVVRMKRNFKDTETGPEHSGHKGPKPEVGGQKIGYLMVREDVAGSPGPRVTQKLVIVDLLRREERVAHRLVLDAVDVETQKPKGSVVKSTRLIGAKARKPEPEVNLEGQKFDSRVASGRLF